MTQEEIKTGNKLIAEFMGFTKAKNGNPLHLKVPLDKELFYQAIHIRIEDIKYHSSWSWLMPVLKKISEKDDIYKAGVVAIIAKYDFDIIEIWKVVVKHLKLSTKTN